MIPIFAQIKVKILCRNYLDMQDLFSSFSVVSMNRFMCMLKVMEVRLYLIL